MPSFVFSLKSTNSEIKEDFFPPLKLDGDYSCGVVSFIVYNSIPNITSKNCVFQYGSTTHIFEEGDYELKDLIDKLKEKFPTLEITANLNTLKIEITGKYSVHFEVENSLASVFGFSKKVLLPHVKHVSDLPVEISTVNNIRILCNIIDNAYFQNKKLPIIHEVPIMVESGYRIVDVPSEIIYLPVNVKEISQLVISIVDDNNNLINFRKEQILIRLHLRKDD